MGSKVISFRFNDAELEALQALQIPEDDSDSQTAARLVRSLLGTSTPSTVSTDVDIKELVKQEVEASLAEVRVQLESLRGKLKAR